MQQELSQARESPTAERGEPKAEGGGQNEEDMIEQTTKQDGSSSDQIQNPPNNMGYGMNGGFPGTGWNGQDYSQMNPFMGSGMTPNPMGNFQNMMSTLQNILFIDTR
jgi:hypothetical protein